MPFKFLLTLAVPMPDPFNGEVKVQKDKGVPHGVYRADAPPPSKRCNLQTYIAKGYDKKFFEENKEIFDHRKPAVVEPAEGEEAAPPVVVCRDPKKLLAAKEARIAAEKRAQEEEERRIAEEEARLKAEEEARIKAEEDARIAAEEEAARLKAEEEARIKAEEEARIKAEEDARIAAEEEAARLKAEEEARIQAEEEAAAEAERKAREEEEEAAAAAAAAEEAELSQPDDTFNADGEHTQEELEKIRKAFSKFDKDDSNAIDPDEIRTCLGSLDVYLSDPQVMGLIEAIDASNSEQIDFDDFVKLYDLALKKQDEPETPPATPPEEHSEDDFPPHRIGFPGDDDQSYRAEIDLDDIPDYEGLSYQDQGTIFTDNQDIFS